MFVDSLRLTGHYAEQSAEILHETTPDLRRDPQELLKWGPISTVGCDKQRAGTPNHRHGVPVLPLVTPYRVHWLRPCSPAADPDPGAFEMGSGVNSQMARRVLRTIDS